MATEAVTCTGSTRAGARPGSGATPLVAAAINADALDAGSTASDLAPQSRLRSARPSVWLRAVLAVGMLAVLTGCPPQAPPGPPVAGVGGELGLEWWAAGDSLFAGYAGVPAAAGHLSGVEVIARSGNTLVEVSLFGVPQRTVRRQITAAVDVHGVPEQLLVHAGVADLVGRAVWGFEFDPARYAEEVVALDEWLTGLGIEVYWVTLVPFAAWSVPGATGQNALRLGLNQFLREHLGERLVDCEHAMLGPDGPWIAPGYVQPDGIHVNGAGARAHATCISAGLADQFGIDLPVTTALGS